MTHHRRLPVDQAGSGEGSAMKTAQEIIWAVNHALRAGPEPTFVYLGRDEMRVLEDDQKKYRGSCPALSRDQKTLCGVRLRFSCEKSRLAFIFDLP